MQTLSLNKSRMARTCLLLRILSFDRVVITSRISGNYVAAANVLPVSGKYENTASFVMHHSPFRGVLQVTLAAV